MIFSNPKSIHALMNPRRPENLSRSGLSISIPRSTFSPEGDNKKAARYFSLLVPLFSFWAVFRLNFLYRAAEKVELFRK